MVGAGDFVLTGVLPAGFTGVTVMETIGPTSGSCLVEMGGAPEGDWLMQSKGFELGVVLGVALGLGSDEGVLEGSFDGVVDGTVDGIVDGSVEGVASGTASFRQSHFKPL